MPRNPAIDVLRGALLLLMTMTHLPTVWSSAVGEPLGFISAAEGFVFLSACMAGKIFIEHWERDGVGAASRWIFSRALRLYIVHLLMLILAFTLVAWIATRFNRPAARNLLDFYLQSPQKAIVGGATLMYRPPLLDILPMYVMFFLGTPVVMRAALRWSWGRVLGVSMVVWVAAQFGLRGGIHALLESMTGWDLPLNASGSFDLYAWQLLWVLGLWFGAIGFGKTRQVIASSGGILNIALALSCAMLAWRYASGPMGFADVARHLFWVDKWTLSPVRVINFAALLLVVIGFGASISRRLRIPRVEALGQASLWVFVAHIAFVLLSLCLIGVDELPLGGVAGVLLVLAGYLILFLTATIYRSIRRPRGQAGLKISPG